MHVVNGFGRHGRTVHRDMTEFGGWAADMGRDFNLVVVNGFWWVHFCGGELDVPEGGRQGVPHGTEPFLVFTVEDTEGRRGRVRGEKRD